ncbi:uncharacterized protein [Miscanthus floridulus]|uniref:uncharacterized protein n=1 Tax=Miscanthus floridulus TaxID=154761 RepID=UPI003458724F
MRALPDLAGAGAGHHGAASAPPSAPGTSPPLAAAAAVVELVATESPPPPQLAAVTGPSIPLAGSTAITSGQEDDGHVTQKAMEATSAPHPQQQLRPLPESGSPCGVASRAARPSSGSASSKVSGTPRRLALSSTSDPPPPVVACAGCRRCGHLAWVNSSRGASRA